MSGCKGPGLVEGLMVASLVIFAYRRDSPLLDKLAEVSAAVAQALIGRIMPAKAIDVFILALKASALVVSAKGALGGCTVAPIE
eukprot:2847545-Ditylum_brightwellii.AAC.1